MTKHVYSTRRIPEVCFKQLRDAGYEVDISEKDGVLTREELLLALRAKPYDAVISLLTDAIDGEVFDAVPSAKIFANYAVGFNNIDLEAAQKRGITITNTPGVLTDTVAEHTIALLLSLSARIAEGDRFVRENRYEGWAPMMFLGTDLKGKILGILGAGRIGVQVGHIASHGLGMSLIYYDVKQNKEFEETYGASFRPCVEDVLKEADVVTVHVPLLDSTHHLLNKGRLSLMKPHAYLVNSSRGPVIDEQALVEALQGGVIKGAALDVYEHEPVLTPGLKELPNTVLTPHIASATEEARGKMSEIVAEDIITFFNGGVPKNIV